MKLLVTDVPNFMASQWETVLLTVYVLEYSRGVLLGSHIITVRNEAGTRLFVFYTCLWFCSQGEGCLDPDPGQRLGGLSGGECKGPGLGGPGPHLGGGGLCVQAQGGASPHPGGVHAHTQEGSRPTTRGVYPSMYWGQTSPSRRLLLRTVRILLECILVLKDICSFPLKSYRSVSHTHRTRYLPRYFVYNRLLFCAFVRQFRHLMKRPHEWPYYLRHKVNMCNNINAK